MNWINRLIIGLVVIGLSNFGWLPHTKAEIKESWKLDLSQSKILFIGKQAGVSFEGHFSQFDGDISFDPSHPEKAHLLIKINMASAHTGDPQKDSALPTSDWFDSSHFSQSIFESRQVIKKSEGTYEATGTLTLKNITHPITLPFTLEITNGVAHAKGKTVLMRNDYQVGAGSWQSPEWVAYDVTILIDIVARQSL